MPRRRAKFPTPGKRLRFGSWRIFWKAGPRFFEAVLGPMDEAEAEVSRLEIALAIRTGEWPPWAADAPAVRRYLAAEAGDSADLLETYARSLRAEVVSTWAGNSLAHLRELEQVAGKRLPDVRPADAQQFLDHVLQTPGPLLKRRGRRSRATRNRALSACSRFYRWAIRTGRVRLNPFQGIPVLSVPAVDEIVYLSRPERNQVLRAANGLPEGVAVWVALWAGLRLGEIARLRWEDVDLERGRLSVRTGKTGRPRVLPLARPLMAYLRRRAGAGRAVAWRVNLEAQKWDAGQLLRALRAACPEIPPKRIGWNAFRHTFATLLAQAGVSLDKISAWMGNSPEICRRHYAQFVPRDHRDEEIDRL